MRRALRCGALGRRRPAPAELLGAACVPLPASTCPLHTVDPPAPPALRSFLIYNGAAELLGGTDIGVLVACLTGLLKHTHLVTSPPVHSSIVQLLLAMLSPQVGGTWGLGLGPGRGGWHDCLRAPAEPRTRPPAATNSSPPPTACPLPQLGGGGGRSLGRSRHVSPAEAALVTAVLGTGAAQTDLLPALMAAYAHADHVVGLDVDKDQARPAWQAGCLQGCRAACRVLCFAGGRGRVPPGRPLRLANGCPCALHFPHCPLPTRNSTISSTCASASTCC